MQRRWHIGRSIRGPSRKFGWVFSWVWLVSAFGRSTLLERGHPSSGTRLKKSSGRWLKEPRPKKTALGRGRLVLGLDARQENLGEVVGLEFGRGVCLAVFTDQVVFDLVVCVAVAGRELDKLNRRIHGVG